MNYYGQMLSFVSKLDLQATIQASLQLNAGRTLRWCDPARRTAITDYLAAHSAWVEAELTPFWEPMAAVYDASAGPWTPALHLETVKLMEAFDLRFTVLIQQAWIRVLLERHEA